MNDFELSELSDKVFGLLDVLTFKRRRESDSPEERPAQRPRLSARAASFPSRFESPGISRSSRINNLLNMSESPSISTLDRICQLLNMPESRNTSRHDRVTSTPNASRLDRMSNSPNMSRLDRMSNSPYGSRLDRMSYSPNTSRSNIANNSGQYSSPSMSRLDWMTDSHNISKPAAKPEKKSGHKFSEMVRNSTDLIECRVKIVQLEIKLKNYETELKSNQIKTECKINLLQGEHKNDTETIEALKEKLKVIQKRELEAKNELAVAKKALGDEKLAHSREKLHLESTVSKLRAIIATLECREDFNFSMWDKQATDLEMSLKVAVKDSEDQKKLVQELQCKLAVEMKANCKMELKDLALEDANRKIRDLQFRLDDFLATKVGSEKLLQFAALEREVKRLRETNALLSEAVRNKLLLEEQVNDLKQKNELMQGHSARNEELQVANATLETELKLWRRTAASVCQPQAGNQVSPTDFEQFVRKHQVDEVCQLNQVMEMGSELKEVKRELDVSKRETEEQTETVADLKMAQVSLQSLIRRLQEKVRLTNTERNSYRLQLDAYEKDPSFCMDVPTAESKTDALAALTQANRSQETSLASYRSMVAQLEEELRKAKPEYDEDGLSRRLEQISGLRAEVGRLQQENKDLRQRQDEADIQLEKLAASFDDETSG